jgi:GT2 family glycosyltransferase
MTSAEPVAAVVVATWNRAAKLERLLTALAAQAEDTPPFEVVIVDNATTDGTAALLERWKDQKTLSLRTVRAPTNGGPSAGRNLGWRATAAPLILFTDDDCEPQRTWVAGLVAALDAGADIAQGQTLPDPAGASRRGAWSHTVHISRLSPFFETCNLSYRRSLLQDLDGFDERFAGASFGEDTDLGWRAKDRGAITAYVPEAVVHHEVTPSSYVAHLKARPRRAGAVRAVKHHPGIRDDLHRHWWLHAGHPPATAALVGVLAAVSRPRSPVRLLLAVAGLASYARFRIRRDQLFGRRRAWPVAIPLALVADVVEVGVMAQASAKHRTLLL